jgi:hypothetical protein
MLLSREVNDVSRPKHIITFSNEEAAGFHQASFAGGLICAKIGWICFLEHERDALAAHAHSIHCVNKGLGASVEKIALSEL